MFDTLRQLNYWTMLLRLILAVIFGGLIGFERERKRMPAGFRTHMLVCLGSCLAMLISQYQYAMIQGPWAEVAGAVNLTTDVSRYGAQVISGIGFLGAGTIIITDSSKVRGVTTAAGLWACACMGLAIGAGFYECAIAGILLIFLTVTVLSKTEAKLSVNNRRIQLYIEIYDDSDVGKVITQINSMKIDLNEIELDANPSSIYPNVLLYLKMPSGMNRSELISKLSGNSFIHAIHRM